MVRVFFFLFFFRQKKNHTVSKLILQCSRFCLPKLPPFHLEQQKYLTKAAIVKLGSNVALVENTKRKKSKTKMLPSPQDFKSRQRNSFASIKSYTQYFDYYVMEREKYLLFHISLTLMYIFVISLNLRLLSFALLALNMCIGECNYVPWPYQERR